MAPLRAKVKPDELVDVEVCFTPSEPGHFSTLLEVQVGLCSGVSSCMGVRLCVRAHGHVGVWIQWTPAACMGACAEAEIWMCLPRVSLVLCWVLGQGCLPPATLVLASPLCTCHAALTPCVTHRQITLGQHRVYAQH